MTYFKTVMFVVASIALLQAPFVSAQEAAVATPDTKADAEVKNRTMRAAPGTPEIDGEIDDIWSTARKSKTDRYVESESSTPAEDSAAAEFRCLWDAKHLYVLAVVKDDSLSTTGEQDWQQDSVEIFVDQNMARSTTYDDDDGQYRVNCEGNISYGQVPTEAMKAVAKKTKTGYIVEAAIELSAITAEKGNKIGFDVQVNDDSDSSGNRSAIMKWSDDTNESYQDVSRLGTLVFGSAKKPKDKTKEAK
jgi:endo-1,4-beta-xylanase